AMKKTFVLSALVSGMMLTNVFATTKNEFQSATVVSVQGGTEANGSNASTSDAPLVADTYSYSIGIQLANVVYQPPYDSAFNDVSPVFAMNHPVQASLKGNVLYVSLPGNRVIPLAIEGRTTKGAAGYLSN